MLDRLSVELARPTSIVRYAKSAPTSQFIRLRAAMRSSPPSSQSLRVKGSLSMRSPGKQPQPFLRRPQERLPHESRTDRRRR